MKKVILIIFFLLPLSACGSSSEESISTNERFVGQSLGSGTDIIIDQETGCKYLFYKSGYAGGLTPFYDEKGDLYCGK